jgi:hypothetical protein
MTVAPMPHDMVVIADGMDVFALESHERRLDAMTRMFEERRGQKVETRGLDTRHTKPRHVTTFGDDSVIVECSQGRDIRNEPKRTIRIFGSEHLYDAQYGEMDTSNPLDLMEHSDIEAAIDLATRLRSMVSRARPARERDEHHGFSPIADALAAYFIHEGLPTPEREFSLWTGRPYGMPSITVRDDRGEFKMMPAVDAAELDRWLPPVASFQGGFFRQANLKANPGEFDWKVDAIEMLRLAAGKAQRCSG